MDARSTSEAMAGDAAQLNWRTGPAGCLIPVALGGALLFLHWAADPAALTSSQINGRRGRGFVLMVDALSWGGVGWGALALSAILAWFAVQLIWRFAERVALDADPRGLRMRGMFGRRVAWREVEAIGIETRGRRNGVAITFVSPQSSLFNPIRHRAHWIAGLDLDGEGGADFVAIAQRHMAAARR